VFSSCSAFSRRRPVPRASIAASAGRGSSRWISADHINPWNSGGGSITLESFPCHLRFASASGISSEAKANARGACSRKKLARQTVLVQLRLRSWSTKCGAVEDVRMWLVSSDAPRPTETLAPSIGPEVTGRCNRQSRIRLPPQKRDIAAFQVGESKIHGLLPATRSDSRTDPTRRHRWKPSSGSSLMTEIPKRSG
jgi:hypothetical protein